MTRKKKGKPNHPAQSTPSTAAFPPAPVESETDKRQDRRITWSLIGAGASFLVSFASAVFAYSSSREAADSNAIARAAQDRAAGKVQARFAFGVESVSPNRLEKFMRKQDGYDRQVFRIENADELMEWRPRVSIKNTGTDPIDAIKTDVHYIVGAAYGVGVQQINPAPIVVNEVSSLEAASFGKLMPGQTAKVALHSLLLNQIARLKWQDYADKDHAGYFTVGAFCRLVGSTSYDRMDSNKPVMIEFHWRPAGFKQDAKHVQELMDFKPSVEIE